MNPWHIYLKISERGAAEYSFSGGYEVCVDLTFEYLTFE